MSFLIVMGMEGIFCALMAAPLAMAAMIIAGLLVHVAKIIFKKDEFNSGKHLTILLLLSPLLVAGVDKAEEPRRASPARVTISDSIRIAATADRIWEALGWFESMDGAKPFLLQLGVLPVPRRCTLEGEGKGSVRTCYFDKGTITQEVTAWQKPSRMEFEITGDTLPGNQWLTFSKAGYELTGEAGQIRVKRHTTIESRLWPRWYWEPIERLVARSEHEFVLQSLSQKLRLTKRD